MGSEMCIRDSPWGARNDRVISYAFDTSPGGIDVAMARRALIPEPSVTLLFVLGLSAVAFHRSKNN